MKSLFEDYGRQLEALHSNIKQAIEGLSSEALDWEPGPEMNSLAVLVTHTAGAERIWIGEMAGVEPSGRDRAAEFRVRGVSAAALSALLDETLAHSLTVLERLTVSDLEARRFSSVHQREYRVAWALVHALEHTALHLGQVQLTRQLWDRWQQTGPGG